LGNTRQGNSFIYIYLDQNDGVSYSPMVFKAFSTHEMISIIESLKIKHSHSYGGISAKLLKISVRYIYIYTGCNRRNRPDFGRVFLMLNYTEKPQNTYIQS
jgi:hypothetical protein